MNQLQVRFERALHSAMPREFERYANPRLRAVANLCRQFGEWLPGGFTLPGAALAAAAGVSAATAHKWLGRLIDDRVLVMLERGDPARKKASRFRYIGPILT